MSASNEVQASIRSPPNHLPLGEPEEAVVSAETVVRLLLTRVVGQITKKTHRFVDSSRKLSLHPQDRPVMPIVHHLGALVGVSVRLIRFSQFASLPMTCCSHCQEAGELFGDEKARSELNQYRRNGPPNKSTRLLIDGLKTLDLHSRSLLDVGGGVGMIQHELLEAGMSEATLVEASPAYLEVAENESRRRGHADRTSFRQGDVVDLAPELPEANVVTLDRVICCYPHMEELVESTAAKATRWYGVTYPRPRWFLHWAKPFSDLYCWWQDMDFRIYLHEGVDNTIRSTGFRRFYETKTFLWTVALYERPGSPTA